MLFHIFTLNVLICHVVNKVILLTNIRSIRQNIQTAVLTYETNEMRSAQETKFRVFSVWSEQLVDKNFIA